MPTLGREFLQGLTNPPLNQGLFDLGASIGGLPGQYQAKKKKEADKEKLLVADEQQKRGEQALSKFATARGMDLKTPEAKEGFFRISNTYGIPVEKATSIYKSLLPDVTDKYKVVGNHALNTETGEFMSPASIADQLKVSDLRQIATPESVVEYIQNGDKNVLVALSGEGGPDTVQASLFATDNVLTTIDKALGLTDEYWTVGYDITKLLPLPTDAKTMDGYTNTLKANLAFDRLQQMRDNSKTGGALGQVSNIELGLLQSSVASLDPGAANFKEQLATVRGQYENFRQALLGLPPKDPKYTELDGNLYYNDKGTYIDLGVLTKTKQGT